MFILRAIALGRGPGGAEDRLRQELNEHADLMMQSVAYESQLASVKATFLSGVNTRALVLPTLRDIVRTLPRPASKRMNQAFKYLQDGIATAAETPALSDTLSRTELEAIADFSVEMETPYKELPSIAKIYSTVSTSVERLRLADVSALAALRQSNRDRTGDTPYLINDESQLRGSDRTATIDGAFVVVVPSQGLRATTLMTGRDGSPASAGDATTSFVPQLPDDASAALSSLSEFVSNGDNQDDHSLRLDINAFSRRTGAEWPPAFQHTEHDANSGLPYVFSLIMAEKLALFLHQANVPARKSAPGTLKGVSVPKLRMPLEIMFAGHLRNLASDERLQQDSYRETRTIPTAERAADNVEDPDNPPPAAGGTDANANLANKAALAGEDVAEQLNEWVLKVTHIVAMPPPEGTTAMLTRAIRTATIVTPSVSKRSQILICGDSEFEQRVLSDINDHDELHSLNLPSAGANQANVLPSWFPSFLNGKRETISAAHVAANKC